MEDNVRNELLENGRIHSMLRSGTHQTIIKPQHVSSTTVSSKSTLRQRKIKEQQAFTSEKISSHTSSKSESFYSTSHLDEGSKKYHSENGSSTKKIQMLTGGQTLNSMSNHKQKDQQLNGNESVWSSSRKSAYLFYKAAGDWWNVFPKTDYTYAKSSTCRREIAPGITTMPNMSRSPLHSYLDRKTMASSAVRVNRSYNEYNSEDDTDACNVSSTTQVTTVKSVITRIVTSIQYMISSVFSVLMLRKYHLGFESTPVTKRSRVVNRSLFHRLEFICYQSACYFLLLDTWILSLFHRSLLRSAESTDKKKHSKYLFLLLIPPLLYLGLWYGSGSNSPLAVLSSSVSGVKNFLPSLSVQKTSTSMLTNTANITMEGGNMDQLIEKLLSSSEFKNILLMQDFRGKEQLLQNEKLMAAVKLEQERIKKELERENQQLDLALTEQKQMLLDQKISNERLTSEYLALNDRIDQLKIQMNLLQARNVQFSRSVKDCRKTIVQTVPRIEIETHVTNFLSGFFEVNDEKDQKSPDNIKVWIKNLIMAKDNLEDRLADTVTVMNERIREATEKSATTIMGSVSDMLRQELLKQEMKMHPVTVQHVEVTGERASAAFCDGCSLTVDKVKEIVNNALNLYDADKTGMVDYALESAGGTVINIRCTENYNDRSLALAFLGMTFPWSSNHPRIALQPEVHPGKCWAFRGAQGYLVIRLAKMIKVSAFSIEHIPVSVSHTGNINAAPKNFSVWGLNNETDNDPVLLGKYIYLKTGPALQIFPVQNVDAPPFHIVELQIESNHGNLEYTCLYRFRVHGFEVLRDE